MKFIIINPFGIGDVTFSTPLIEVLKKNFPASYIAYLCNRRVSEVIATNPYLDRIFVYEKDDFRDLWKKSKWKCIAKALSFLNSIKKERFDISIDLSLAYQYTLLLKYLGVKKRIGLNYRNRGRFLTDKVQIKGFDDKHVIEYYLDVLRLLDIDTARYGIATRVYPDENILKWSDAFLKDNNIGPGDLVIGMLPGCGASWGSDAEYRRWKRSNFALLADKLIERYGAKIILLGNKQEVAVGKEVEALMKHRLINCCGRTSIKEFIGILSKCRVVITNDGGPLHMAVALGVKTVSIYGPVDEKIYGPYPTSPKHIVLSRKDLPCRPCYKKFKYTRCENKLCLDLITVEDALGATEEMLKR